MWALLCSGSNWMWPSDVVFVMQCGLCYAVVQTECDHLMWSLLWNDSSWAGPSDVVFVMQLLKLSMTVWWGLCYAIVQIECKDFHCGTVFVMQWFKLRVTILFGICYAMTQAECDHFTWSLLCNDSSWVWPFHVVSIVQWFKFCLLAMI